MRGSSRTNILLINYVHAVRSIDINKLAWTYFAFCGHSSRER